MTMKNDYEEMLNKFYIYVQYFIDLCIKSMFTLALVFFFKLISRSISAIEPADQNPSVYKAAGKFMSQFQQSHSI